MTRSHKVLGFVFVAMLGLYGCARGPSTTASADRAALEAKVQRLEEDFRAAAAARDGFRKRLLASEDKLTAAQQSLQAANAAASQQRKDQETLRAELKARTTERDTVLAQYDGFRKNIKDLLGTAETALNSPSKAVPSVTVSSTTGPAPVTTASIRN